MLSAARASASPSQDVAGAVPPRSWRLAWASAAANGGIRCSLDATRSPPYPALVATVIFGDFEWDSGKASSNRAKHAVSFEEAAEAMRDPRSVDFEDIAHPENTVTLAMSPRDRILYVVTTQRGERVRLISARVATSHERRLYEEDP
jgi:uncharacterized protein